MKTPRPRFILTCSVVTLLSASARPQAVADDFWNVSSGDWNTASNWSDGTVPSGENADVNMGVATISTSIIATPNDIVVGDTTSGTLNQTGGTAQTGVSNWMYVGRSGGTGVYNLANTAATGGTLTGCGTGAGSMTVGQRFYVGGYQPDGGGTGTANINTTGSLTVNGDTCGSGGAGTLNLDAGTFNRTGGWCFVGGNYNGTAGGQGTINISGGTMMQSGDTYFGRGAGSAGTLNMTGGTLTGNNLHFGFDGGEGTGVANLSGTSVVNLTGSLLVADGSTNIGTVTIGGSANVTTGGTLTIGNGNGTSAAAVVMNGGMLTTNGEFQVGNESGTGSFTQNGGAVTANNWVTTGRHYNDSNDATGTFTKTAGSTGFFNITNAAGDVGTVNLNGGVLTVDKIVANGGATTAASTLNFNGGTLRASSNGTTDPGSGTNVAGDVTFLQGVTQVNVRNGGAVVDTNGFSITFNQVLSHSNVAGDSTTDGGLTANSSSGSGVLTLTAANTFNGGTFINAGVVIAQNSSAFGTGTVAQSDGTNSVNSRVSGVELQGGITLANNFITSNNGDTTNGSVGFAIDSNTGANAITGTITLRNGGGDTVIQSDSGSFLALSGNISIGSGYSGRNLVLQGASTGANTITGVISNGGATLGIGKSGAGTWTLSNANTYTGATTVNAGILSLGATNAAQATSGITVNSTGTLLVSAKKRTGHPGGFYQRR